MTLRDDIDTACEGARDFGKHDGSEGLHRNMRPPSIERLENWIVRVLRELPDDSVTVREILEALE